MVITPAQLIQRIRDHRRARGSRSRIVASRPAFTLVEIIIASSIFTIVSLIGVTVFVNVTRIQKRISLENSMYEDGRFMMERLAREIRENTVDYEEYYNKNVDGADNYGAGYGCYSTRFYNPGSGGPGTGGLGAYCNDGSTDPADLPGCTIDKRTLDKNTGANPYGGNSFGADKGAEKANAFCDQHFAGDTFCDTSISLYTQSDLYLIDSKGKQKTMFTRKKIAASPDGYALGMLQIRGEDTNQNDVVETWYYDGPPKKYYCADGFDCPDTLASLELTNVGTTPATMYQGFVPMSPSRTNVKNLKFHVSPLEDPRKAFAETDADQGIQQQPHVTIVMTLEPAASELASFAGAVPTVTLQTTVSSRVYNEVRSFEGRGNCSAY